MPRSLPWARLLVAGSCCLPGLAQAESPRVSPRAQVAGAIQPSPAQLRSEAARVELAWLADPTTFALPLEVASRGDELEVRGKVPDEATRQHVLLVARQSCYLPVHDGLTI